MSIIAFALAAFAAGAAALLWRLDARQRSRPAREPKAEMEPRPEEPAEPQPEPLPEPLPERRHGLSLPGALRRERRAWAEEKGFEFSRSDDWLNDEWSRGAAASGAAAKDIVSGQAYGHEMVLMDLGGVNVMAVRRGAASDVVIDARRVSAPEQESSSDLIEAFTLGEFRVLATDTGVAQRLVDDRVTIAFQVLPEIVTAVWMESDWVLAQTARGSHAGDWEEMLAPLAMLADAARALPPRATAAQVLQLEDLDPTRQMPEPPKPGFGVVELVREGVEPGERPLVQRPEEPLDMPSRRQSVARGVVEPRGVGADEVLPIADGSRDDHPRGVQMPRDLRRGPSIFGDEPEA
ncbi:type III secretion system chaperone family protein [Corynebacterium comes]|nr:hypothetical protein [Corynebacterium comes]